MPAQDAVRKASKSFYSALNSMAIETGVEKGQITVAGRKVGVEQRVTNVYKRTERSWKIVHHHTDLSPEMIDLRRKLQARK